MHLLLLTAGAYFYFNWQYFLIVKKLREMPCLRVWIVLVSFAVNYLFFVICSLLEFSLILNWFLFAFLLYSETLFYNKGSDQCALCSTLMGILYGLAVNIFCRSIVAILMDQPMQRFDNCISSVANLKGIPVCLGFLLAGVIMQLIGHHSIMKRLQLIKRHTRHHAFLLEIMGGLLLYLFLNLLLYSAPRDELILKLWSIKSCLFSIIGFYIAMRYTVRICELEDYREKNQRIEQKLQECQWEEGHLRRQAALDSLTGLFNRQFAEETLADMMENSTAFTVCFLDLDGLKTVNDLYGHEEGDRYILTAIEKIQHACRSGDILFRYGGDEFLALFAGMTAEAVEKRAEAINEELCALKADSSFSYLLSLSYGVVESVAFSDWKEMVREADRRMYEQKRCKQVARE